MDRLLLLLLLAPGGLRGTSCCSYLGRNLVPTPIAAMVPRNVVTLLLLLLESAAEVGIMGDDAPATDL